MSKQYNNFMHKFLMYMGLVMLYLTVVYIVPIELNSPFDNCIYPMGMLVF